MPEKAEIAIMSDNLASKLTNKNCKKIIIMNKYREAYGNELYSSSPLNYNQEEGFKWLEVDSILSRMSHRGKKIIFEFDRNKYEPFRFVSSCGLTGHWSWQQSKYTVLMLIFDEIIAYYEEVRFGGNFSVCLYPSSEYNHIFKDVGPDLMMNDTTFEIYNKIIRGKRIVNLKICEFMMEQKYLSGIGNWLRAEILYKARINPHRILNSLSEQDVYSLFYYSKETILEGYKMNGLTIQDYLDMNGNKGIYKPLCYGRKFDDYNNPIITEKDRNDRTIHWCPSLQI